MRVGDESTAALDKVSGTVDVRARGPPRVAVEVRGLPARELSLRVAGPTEQPTRSETGLLANPVPFSLWARPSGKLRGSDGGTCRRNGGVAGGLSGGCCPTPRRTRSVA